MDTVSDLHCPATLVVARHAKAAFVETWFSDEGGSLTSEGRAQAAELAESLRERRIAGRLGLATGVRDCLVGCLLCQR